MLSQFCRCMPFNLQSVALTVSLCVCVCAVYKYRSVEDGPVSLSRCSCCEVRSPSSWTSSSPTPHSANLCPSSAFSSHIDLCLQPSSSDWHEQSGGKTEAGALSEKLFQLHKLSLDIL